jgi:hypothetical protein
MKPACNALITIALLLPFTNSSRAQSSEVKPSVSTAFAVITKTIELKNATIGQELVLRTISDIVVDGEVVVPKGANFMGHVKDVAIRSKEVEQSALSVVLDKVVIKAGLEIPVQAIIAAVAAPANNSLDADPAYGMMHSNEPKMVGSAGNTTRSGGLSASSKAGSNAAVATAEFKGHMDQALLLDATSQGAVGYEGLSVSWQLTTPPPVTVFSTRNKNVKLEAGAQVLLRMSTPRIGR